MPILLFFNRLIENSDLREVSPEHLDFVRSLCSGEHLFSSGDRKIARPYARLKTKCGIREKKVIDQKVGLENYQHYLTSVAHTGGSGLAAKLKYKNIQFLKKNSATGCFVITLIKTSSSSSSNFLKFIKSAQKQSQDTRHFQHLGNTEDSLVGWKRTLDDTSW